MPTFTSRVEPTFDLAQTPSAMGLVTEVFRKMPGALRSRHPRHPVAALGKRAHELLEEHERAVGPCGEGTPFAKHAQMGGQILLIGVNLDTLTLLHTAEAQLDLPYLQTLEAKYLDEHGKIVTTTMRQVPGGHRGGVRRFERIFHARGLIRYGQLGRARTMLMDARPILQTMVELLRADLAAALSAGDHYPDDVCFKARIRARQLQDLGAELTIVLPRMPDDHTKFARMIDQFGCPPTFALTRDLPVLRAAPSQSPPQPPADGSQWVLQPAPEDLIQLDRPPAGFSGLAYAPEAAHRGLQPFYDVLYKTKCRDHVTDIFVNDGLSNLPGFLCEPLAHLSDLVPDGRVILGEGHAQLRHIISAMRMRNLCGRYHLVVPDADNLHAQTWRRLKEFWALFP